MDTPIKQMKYQEQIAVLEKGQRTSCVGNSYSEMDVKAYRWTFEDINDKRNFSPRALDSTHPQKQRIEKSCGGWSLSFFTSEEYAKNKLSRICSDKPKLYLKLGTHLAEGTIEKADGKSGDFNNEGHFEHFEYERTDFSKKFNVKTRIYPIA